MQHVMSRYCQRVPGVSSSTVDGDGGRTCTVTTPKGMVSLSSQEETEHASSMLSLMAHALLI